MLLNKEQIFNFQDLDVAVVNVPEWGGDVKIKALCVADQMDLDAKKKDFAPGRIVVEMVVRSCVNEDGSRMFNLEDADELDKKSPQAIMRLFNEIMKLNTIKEDDIKAEAKN